MLFVNRVFLMSLVTSETALDYSLPVVRYHKRYMVEKSKIKSTIAGLSGTISGTEGGLESKDDEQSAEFNETNLFMLHEYIAYFLCQEGLVSRDTVYPCS